jgi:hypothetical protein
LQLVVVLDTNMRLLLDEIFASVEGSRRPPELA